MSTDPSSPLPSKPRIKIGSQRDEEHDSNRPEGHPQEGANPPAMSSISSHEESGPSSVGAETTLDEGRERIEGPAEVRFSEAESSDREETLGSESGSNRPESRKPESRRPDGRSSAAGGFGRKGGKEGKGGGDRAGSLRDLEAELLKPSVPLPLRRGTDAELEAEIAAAMGSARVDDLLSQQVKESPAQVELELDGRYRGTVIKTYRDSVLFELPGGQNGVVSARQFESIPEPGTVLDVVVVRYSADEQIYDLIVPGASVKVADWSDISEGLVVEATITGHNKGGLECEVNHIRGFIPGGQVSLYRVEDFSSYVGSKLPCVVTEANPERRNLVLSHRAILEREREETREKLLAELAVGQMREGVVTRIQKFGAFVDLGGIDGLIHIGQLSWDNIRHPSEVVQEGQRVKVRVDKIDPATGKIGLSYRDLMHHPWEGIDSKYTVGSVVKGTVSKLMEFGAFVKLEPGVEGLVHISELSHKRVARVSQVVQEGETIDVKILSVDPESQRISLSLKGAQASGPEEETGASPSETDAPVAPPTPKRPAASLKGGLGKGSGGDSVGLQW